MTKPLVDEKSLPPVCSHKLCDAEAVEPIDVTDARAACIFTQHSAGVDSRVRHYELCAEHFASYLPQGHGWIDKANAARLRIQCKAMA